MTSSAVRAPPSFAPRRTRRSRTPTPNDGLGPSAANSVTGPSSGTTDNSHSSSTNTSSTTTRTDHIAAFGNAHRTRPKLSRIGLADRSDDTPPATDSSTNTAKQPEPSTTANPKRTTPTFGAPTPPPRDSTHAANTLQPAPDEYSAPTRCFGARRRLA